MENPILKKTAALAAAAAVVALALSGCWGGATGTNQSASATPDASVSCIVSCQDVPQADHAGPSALALDKAAEDEAINAASTMMAAYTDTGKSKDEWFKALAPLVTTAYAQEAQYIQPPRLSARTVTSAGSIIPAEVPDGHQVRVKFSTNAGEWAVIMTRAASGAPWLASNVLPLEAI